MSPDVFHIILQSIKDPRLGMIKMKKGWVLAKCEVCGIEWKVQKSLVTRTCSRKCGAKINPFSRKDPTKWIDVPCTMCGTNVHKRLKDVGEKSFCSRACRSKGMAIYANSRSAKSSRAKGVKRGKYTDTHGQTHRYDFAEREFA